MKGFRKTCLVVLAALALGVALTRPAFAGDMQCGASSPGSATRDGLIHMPLTADQTGTGGEIHTGTPERQDVGGEIQTTHGIMHTPLLMILYLFGAALP